MTTNGEWLSDESKEEFYDTYFGIIEDIPDEWSLEDQQKSHGIGKPEESRFLTRWWSNWICNEHMWIWGRSKHNISEWCKEQNIDTYTSILDRLSKLYRERLPREVVHKKKEFILVP